MSNRWALGPEVTRTSVERGAMLYDSSRAGNLDLQWFDVRHWESQNAIEGDAKGRGRARFINAHGLKLVLRSYRRGGLVARLFSRQRYVWHGEDRTRPFREWQLTYRMHRAGLPVAAPIGAHYRRRFGLYTGELITERLSVKGTMADCLMKESLSVLTWVAIGRCIRRFHDFGVCHADLNLRNVLIGEEDDVIYLIDFDRCSLRKPGLWRDSNLVRLRRSLEKVTYGLPPDRFTEADWHALLDGYRQSSTKAPLTGGFGPVTVGPFTVGPYTASTPATAVPAAPAATTVHTEVLPRPPAHTEILPRPLPAAATPAEATTPTAPTETPPPAPVTPPAPTAPTEILPTPTVLAPAPAAPSTPADAPESTAHDPSQAVTLLRAPKHLPPATLFRAPKIAESQPPPAWGRPAAPSPPAPKPAAPAAGSTPQGAAGQDIAAGTASPTPRKESAP